MGKPVTSTFDWTEIDDDPTCASVRASVLSELQRVRLPSVQRKSDLVRDFVSGRRVLDLGVVGHTLEASDDDGWLHGQIKGWSSELVGVDLLEDSVAALRERGFDVVCADATSELDLGRRFERVVMGDLLEHVNDPVKLLRFAKRHLEPGGLILATTPNPFYFAWIYESLRLGVHLANAEHATWVGPTMALELARRADVALVGYRLLRPLAEPGTWRTRLLGRVTSTLLPENELFAQSYAYVFGERGAA